MSVSGLLRGVVLLALWVALWGDLSVANVASGVVVVVLLALVVRPAAGVRHVPSPIGMLVLAWHVLADLVVSSVGVARAVLQPTPERTVTAVVPVPLTTRSPLIASIVANAITLTPGTMTVDVDVDVDGAAFVLRVHVLGRVDPDEFRDGIALLERRVVAAAGGKAAGGEVDGR
jgi:multicomponent Na+:H+ antiporter subunit E